MVDRVVNRLRQESNATVTTFIDYYGRKNPNKWKNQETITSRMTSGAVMTGVEKCQLLAEGMADVVASRLKVYNMSATRFVPFVCSYELEGLLFSAPEVLSQATEIPAEVLQQIVDSFGGFPEEINDNPETAPSKRLEQLSREYTNLGYLKTISGPMAAGEMGIDTIRDKCPHFDNWLDKLGVPQHIT